MKLITAWNCDGLCIQRYCGNPPIFYEYVHINDVEVIITLCDKHAKEYEEGETLAIIKKYSLNVK